MICEACEERAPCKDIPLDDGEFACVCDWCAKAITRIARGEDIRDVFKDSPMLLRINSSINDIKMLIKLKEDEIAYLASHPMKLKVN